MKKGNFHRLDYLDIFLLLTVLVAAGYYLVAKINLSAAPAEDAAMLMRYAKHLGDGLGIVWNPGEAPVDGATDFLFMMLLGGLYRLGISLEAGVQLIGIGSHFLTILLVYFGSRRMSGSHRWVAWLSAAFLAVSPGLRYVEASFGTPFFAFFVALTWYLAVIAADRPQSTTPAALFGLSSLVTGLIRPEGVIVAAFMMLAIVVKTGFKASRKILLYYLLIYFLVGGTYFLWHWNYFGYPLPNPFYRKGGGLFYPDSLNESFKNTLNLSFPFWLAYLYGLALWLWLGLRELSKAAPVLDSLFTGINHWLSTANGKTRVTWTRIGGGIFLASFVIGLSRTSSPLHTFRLFGWYSPNYALFLAGLLILGCVLLFSEEWFFKKVSALPQGLSLKLKAIFTGDASEHISHAARQSAFLLIPAGGYILMWGLLSNEMNYLSRFQYAILPVILISWPGFFANFRKIWSIDAVFSPKPAARVFIGTLVVLISLAVLRNQYEQYLFNYQKDGRFEIARELQEFSGKGYTIATSEAGLLPLYSDWKAIDSWGLNDSWIAHNGGISAEYIDRYKPEVIMFHADFSPLLPPVEGGDKWKQMVLTLKQYAEAHQYELAAVFGPTPENTHYYYVRPDFADSTVIVQKIRDMEKTGYYFGARSINFINFQRSNHD
jgi:hypothetical protein